MGGGNVQQSCDGGMERLLLKNANCIEQSGANGQVNKQIAKGFQVRVLEAVFRNGLFNR